MSKLKILKNAHMLYVFIVYMLIGAMIGFILSAIVIDARLEKEGRYDSIELQHKLMIEQNETFRYCPYCGEELER